MGVDYKELKELNPQFTTEYAPAYAEKKLVIRVPKGSTDKATVAIANCYIENQVFLAKLRTNSYSKVKVRRGDTISTIARRIHVSIARLRDLNGFKSGTLIRSGRYIKVPM